MIRARILRLDPQDPPGTPAVCMWQGVLPAAPRWGEVLVVPQARKDDLMVSVDELVWRLQVSPDAQQPRVPYRPEDGVQLDILVVDHPANPYSS